MQAPFILSSGIFGDAIKLESKGATAKQNLSSGFFDERNRLLKKEGLKKFYSEKEAFCVILLDNLRNGTLKRI